MKIRKGDRVQVLSGKDRGKTGSVTFAYPATGKVVVDGLNVAKKHQKPKNTPKNPTYQGGIIDKEMPMPVSNVAIVCAVVRQAHPRRLPLRSRRHQGSHLSEVPGGSGMSDVITIPRLKQRYNDEIRSQLKETLGLGNIMEVPRLEKIVINMGVGAATDQARLLDGAISDLATITGQKPLTTRAKKSIAGFKLREGNAIGAKVTLRGDRMWEFFDRLISLAIPRIRDFRGLPANSFDGRGNYTFGVTEQLIFPEIDYDKVDTTRGMDITIVTTARTNAEGKALLDAFGFPFKREGQQ